MPLILLLLALGILWLSVVLVWRMLQGDLPGGDARTALSHAPRILIAPLSGIVCLVGSWQSRRVRCNCDEADE